MTKLNRPYNLHKLIYNNLLKYYTKSVWNTEAILIDGGI